MAVSTLSYPLIGIDDQRVGLWLELTAKPFHRTIAYRSTGGLPAAKQRIMLPLPQSMSSGSAGEYSVEKAKESLLTKAANLFSLNNIENLIPGVGATKLLSGIFESVTGAGNTIGKKSMDQRENVFKSNDLREYEFNWTFVPKSREESQQLFNIAYRMQALCYPGAALQASKVYHPPLWTIKVLDIRGGKATQAIEWDFEPMPCVLQTIAINRTAAEGNHAIGNYNNIDPTGKDNTHTLLPAAWSIQTKFQELEPNVRNAEERVVSRSLREFQGQTELFAGEGGIPEAARGGGGIIVTQGLQEFAEAGFGPIDLN